MSVLSATSVRRLGSEMPKLNYLEFAHGTLYCLVAQSAARSNLQFEAVRFRKRFRRKTERAVEEQWFRALSCFEARPSNDFGRPMAAEHGRATISSAKHSLCNGFECCPLVSTSSGPRLERIMSYLIRYHSTKYAYCVNIQWPLGATTL